MEQVMADASASVQISPLPAPASPATSPAKSPATLLLAPLTIGLPWTPFSVAPDTAEPVKLAVRPSEGWMKGAWLQGWSQQCLFYPLQKGTRLGGSREEHVQKHMLAVGLHMHTGMFKL